MKRIMGLKGKRRIAYFIKSGVMLNPVFNILFQISKRKKKVINAMLFYVYFINFNF